MRNRIVGFMLEGETPVPVYVHDFARREQFARWVQEPLNLEIERTSVRLGLLVSTAFLGVNRATFPQKDLVLWETRVVRDGSPAPPLRYSSAAAARTGHWELVYNLHLAECLPISAHTRDEIAAHVPAGYWAAGVPSERALAGVAG